MYHKIYPDSPTLWWVTVDDFYRQMCELKYRKVVYLDNYDPNNPEQVVITFDGVYKNVLDFAAPILKKMGYPFELFITGDFIGRDNENDSGEPRAQFASEEDLKELVRCGGRLQWHGKTHMDLESVTVRETISKELTVPDNLRLLDQCGFSWLAYSHGNINEQVVREAEKRFKGALSCHQGNDSNVYKLNRVTVTNETSFKKCAIAVIIASYNYGHYLVEAVESVLRQTRKADEILISDDCSSDNTADIAREYKKAYPRLIKVNINKSNLGIVNHFNKAIALTTSEYVCFLGADNRLRSDYIEKTAGAIDADDMTGIAYSDFALFGPRAKMTYARFSDSWKGQVKGTFYCIQFPDFTTESRKTLSTTNFMHGSSMYRRKAFLDAGGYIDKESVPEDYNLFLRIVNKGWKAARVPHPILEYRQHSRDQANIKSISYAELMFYQNKYKEFDKALSEKNSLISSLQLELNSIRNSRAWKILIKVRELKTRMFTFAPAPFLSFLKGIRLLLSEGPGVFLRKIAGKTRTKLSDTYFKPPIIYKEREEADYIPNHPANSDVDLPEIDIIIVTYNSSGFIEDCLDSIKKSNYPRTKVRTILLDNNSTDKTLEILNKYRTSSENITVIENKKNIGFGRGYNKAFEFSKAPYALLLNPDTRLDKDCLKQLTTRALLTEFRGVVAWEARQLPYEHPKSYDPVTLETDWVSGACFLIKCDTFIKHGFDPHIFLYCEDVDLSWRLRKSGGKLMYVPAAVVHHETFEDADTIKPNQFYNSIVSNGILRYKYGSLRDILLFYIQYLWILLMPPPLKNARPLIAKYGIKLLMHIPQSLLWRYRSRGENNSHFTPFFNGWNFEIRRRGAFYRNRPLSNKPLVSIIIRTKGRPYFLREALQSIRNQTYDNIEVLVIEDREDSAHEVISAFKDLPVHYIAVGDPGGRCRAGNTGLKQTSGKYINFLDDDDLFFADHVETLVGELENSKECLAAYSVGFEVQTDIISTSPFRYKELNYSTPYARAHRQNDLLVSNYIPINCMMFSKQLYLKGGGFDESLTLLEDWDLWIAYSKFTDFLFVDKTTCLYRVPGNRDLSKRRASELYEAYNCVRSKHIRP